MFVFMVVIYLNIPVVSKSLVRITRVCLIWLSQESRGKELRGSVHGDSVSSVLALQVLITRCAGPRHSETWRPTTTPGHRVPWQGCAGVFFTKTSLLCAILLLVSRWQQISRSKIHPLEMQSFVPKLGAGREG